MKLALGLGIAAALTMGQTARPDNAQSLAHVEAAKKLAGNDEWLQGPFSFYCVAGKARPNSTAAPESKVQSPGSEVPGPDIGL